LRRRPFSAVAPFLGTYIFKPATFEHNHAAANMKNKTVRKHLGNVSFYIDDYLLYDDIVRPQEGLSAVNGFFPRKAMWSSVASTKETVASLKKFYRHLTEIGLVEAPEYQEFLAEVKSEMPEWLEHYRDIEAW
jgi:hypothetical protein